MSWIEFPRPGTTVLDGRWLATVTSDAEPQTLILVRRDGEWEHLDGVQLGSHERVTAIDFVPHPYER